MGRKVKDKKFTRVTLDYELRANADGMPVFRKCFENEILLSFYDDEGAWAFREWWEEVASQAFAKWCMAEGHEDLIR